jgi:hypothetical protein
LSPGIKSPFGSLPSISKKQSRMIMASNNDGVLMHAPIHPPATSGVFPGDLS